MNNSNRVLRFVLGAETGLLIPFIGMMVSSQVDWNARDFLIASVLLAGFGASFSMVVNKTSSVKHTAIGLVLVALILLIWAELAVGIIGSPVAGS